MRFSQDIIPTLTIKQTQGHVSDQGITYNQSGLTYNQLGYSYGGFYGFADVQPIISLTASLTPRISGFSDIYTNNTPPPPNTNHSVGPGWFMYVTTP